MIPQTEASEPPVPNHVPDRHQMLLALSGNSNISGDNHRIGVFFDQGFRECVEGGPDRGAGFWPEY